MNMKNLSTPSPLVTSGAYHQLGAAQPCNAMQSLKSSHGEMTYCYVGLPQGRQRIFFLSWVIYESGQSVPESAADLT